MLSCYCGKLLVGRRKKYCSYSCKNKLNVADWRRSLKKKAIEYKGGKCIKCGYRKCVGALHFHHTRDKDFIISHAGRTISWEKVKIELDKCILLCANCHAEAHEEERLFPNSSKVERVAVNDTVVGSSPT